MLATQTGETPAVEVQETSLARAEEGDEGGTRGPRVFRSTRAEHYRTFRWGVGNRFRMQSQNRFVPVHQPHPKQVMVRDEYYESENPNIVWEELNEAWEVFWYENNKLNARPFVVKKFGIERAKREAFAFFEELQAAGRHHEPPKHEDPQPGVFFDGRLQSWVCLFWRGNRPLSRAWAATKYGYEGAKALAVAKQKDPANGVLPLAHVGGGSPAQDRKLSRFSRRVQLSSS